MRELQFLLLQTQPHRSKIADDILQESKDAISNIETEAKRLVATHRRQSPTYAAIEVSLKIAESAIVDRDATIFALRQALRSKTQNHKFME